MDNGTVTETSTYAREIMSVALQRRAASIVLVHNHPSGDPARVQQTPTSRAGLFLLGGSWTRGAGPRHHRRQGILQFR